MLERFARAGSGAAVRQLSALAPGRAREIILADLAAERPRIPPAAAAILPDETLPSLDSAFVAQLRGSATAGQSRGTFQRIARFATPAILRDVQAAYRVNPAAASCALTVPVLAYVFKSDAAAGKTMFDRVQRRTPAAGTRCDEGWRQDLLGGVAGAAWSPGLEGFALELVASGEPAAIASAARTLSRYGSASTEAALWGALRRWRERTESKVRSETEESLMRGLIDGVAWRFTREDVGRLQTGCRFTDCATHVADLARSYSFLTPDAEPTIDARIGDDVHELEFTLDVYGLTLRQLDARLALFQPGTAFHWNRDSGESFSGWYVDLARPFREAEALVRRHGMTLHRSAGW
jgi:hypothetical protein